MELDMPHMTRQTLIEEYPVPKTRPGLRRWIKKLGFPKPVYAHSNLRLWSPEAVEEWFESRSAYRFDAGRVTHAKDKG